MLVSLPNGKVIEVSLEQYLSMTDEDFKYLVSRNWGEEISDPFYNSCLSTMDDEPTDEELQETEEDFRDLTSYTDDEKLSDDYFHEEDTE